MRSSGIPPSGMGDARDPGGDADGDGDGNTSDLRPIGALDPFRRPEAWDDDAAATWAQALDNRATSADQLRIRRRLLDLAGLRPGDHAVELGSGTGLLLTELAQVVGTGGGVLGVEPQPLFARQARDRAARCHAGAPIVVHEGSAERIPAVSGTVSACVAHTVLVHLPAPTLQAALTEAERVLIHGGRFVTADQDGDTWVIDHPDRRTTRRIVAFNSDQRYADGWTGRRLPRLLREHGFHDVRIEIMPTLDTAADSYLFRMAVRLAAAAADAGVLEAGEAERWVTRLRELAAGGSFFSSINYYICVGTSRTRAEAQPAP